MERAIHPPSIGWLADLGKPEDIGKLFAGFQKHL